MITRRNMLKTAAAAAVAPSVFVRSAHITAAEPANNRITVGVIGVGTMGRGHLGRLLGNAGVEVVAVCDVVEERRENARKMIEKSYSARVKSGDYKFKSVFNDFRQVLELPGLDAVLIATPDHWHAIPCILAARAKKHIYCEKPLTHNIAEGKAIVQEVNKAKITFQTGSQQRTEFGGHFRRAVEFVWAGRIGTIKTIRIGVGGPSRPCDLPTQEAPPGTDWDTWLGPAPDRPYHSDLCPKGVHSHFPAWRNYRDYAGGLLADMGAHHFDIAQWGMETDKTGPVQVIPPKDPKTGQGLRFIYANGVTVIHNEFEKDPMTGKEIKADCLFEGTNGKILASRGGLVSMPGDLIKEPIKPENWHVYPSTNHHQNWLDCIRTGARTICPVEVGHRSASICHLGNIGYRLGRPLKWDPAAEQFVDDASANKELSREPRAKWKIV